MSKPSERSETRPADQPEHPSPPTSEEQAARSWVTVMATCLAAWLIVAFTERGTSGWLLLVGLPVAVGVGVGLIANSSSFGLMALSSLVMAGIIGVTICQDVMGLFCGLMLWLLALPIVVAAAILGAAMKPGKPPVNRRKKRPPFQHAWMLVPFACWAIDTAFPPKMSTIDRSASRVIARSAGELWATPILAGEPTPPPTLPFRVGLTRPESAEGRATRVGDEKTFRYSKGHMRIRVTRSEPGRDLAFDVIEQVRLEDKAARLHGGRLTIEPIGDDRCRVTLTARYVPKLAPRPVWRPIEGWALDAILQDVLERIATGSASAPGS